MDQQPLFCDTLEEALRGAVNALKGPKAVGVSLWPELSADVAAKRLNHCLDPDRPEKLEMAQIVLIAKRARMVGCHTVMGFLGQQLDYVVTPVDPETEVQRLQREFIEAQRQLSRLADQINAKQSDVAQMRRAA